MQKVSNLQSGGWWNVVFLLIALLVVAADQLSKLWIRSSLLVGQSLFETGFFRLTYVRNAGAAFDFLQGQSFLLTIAALIAIAVLLVFIVSIQRHSTFLDSRLGRVAIGLVLGGTVGNLIDRLRFGYVTDFIDFGFWPAFNIADSAVTVGVILFAYSIFFLYRAEKH